MSARPVLQEGGGLWTCPACGARLVSRNLSHSCGRATLADWTARMGPRARALYGRFEAMIGACGAFHVAPAKTRIAFMARVRFAAITSITEQAMTCSFSLPRPLSSPRFVSVDEVVPGWWVHRLRIADVSELDEQVQRWLRRSYSLMGLQQRLADTPARRFSGFLEEYPPEVRALARAVLAKMRRRLPGAVEIVDGPCDALVVAFGPSDRTSEAIFSIALSPRHVTLFFLDGSSLEDPDGLLQGSGSRVRSIRLDEAAVLDRKPVVRLMAHAVRAAKQRFDGKASRRMIIKSVSAKQRPGRPRRRQGSTMRYVAFLRAINVGGHVVKMDRLRKLFEEAGFTGVETFIASGNVIFESPARDTAALENRIEKHLKKALGYEVGTFVRTHAEVAAAGHEPFDAASDSTVYVVFLKSAPDKPLTQKVMALRTDADDFHVRGREIYWRSRGRISKSPAAVPFAKAFGAGGTMRNVTTVRKLASRYGG